MYSNFANFGEFTVYFNQILGKGSFGEVYKGIRNSNGEEVAVKSISMNNANPSFWESIQNEISIMMQMNNPNIVRLYNFLRTQTNIFLFVEFCNGGDLRRLLKKQGVFPERTALRYLKDLLNACYELFTRGIIHRDLKPENILLNDNVAKLADFGLAKHVSSVKNVMMESSVGTPLYMSLQILKNQKYTSKSDIWSIGVIYYEMLYGVLPYSAFSQWELVEKIQNQIITFPSNFIVSEQSTNFIIRCLQKEEENRFSWEDVYLHPLFRKTYRYSVIKNNLEQKAIQIKKSITDYMSFNNLNVETLVNNFSGNKGYFDTDTFQNFVLFLLPNCSPQEITNLFSLFDIMGENKITIPCLYKSLSNKRDESPEKQNSQNSGNAFNFRTSLEKKSNKESIINRITQISYYSKEIKEKIKPFLSDKRDLTEKDFYNLLPILDNTLTNSEIGEIFNFFNSEGSGIVQVETFKRGFELNFVESANWSQSSKYNLPELSLSGNSSQTRNSLEVQKPSHVKRRSRFEDDLQEPDSFHEIKSLLRSQNLSRLFKTYSQTADKEILNKKEFFNLMDSLKNNLTKMEKESIFQYVKKTEGENVTVEILTEKIK